MGSLWGLVAVAAAAPVLRPGQPVKLSVLPSDMGMFQYDCDGKPADVRIDISSWSCNPDCDPLLLLSRGSKRPQMGAHDSNSFDSWRTDAGSHTATLSQVGPEGGWVAVVNMAPFSGHMDRGAQQALSGELTITCAEILVFDFLFWDDVKEPLCPRGAITAASNAPAFCSGHGTCTRGNQCECNQDYAGPSCMSPKKDISLEARGTFSDKIRLGDYLYFKVRVPESFEGGVLDVTVASRIPLAVLVSDRKVPTTASYDFSNFEDWLAGKNRTRLRLPVVGMHSAQRPVTSHVTRRLAAACSATQTKPCESSCMQCIVARSAGPATEAACDKCDDCLPALAACAPADCRGPEAKKEERCSKKCRKCLACTRSNDELCGSSCGSCEDCLPWVAKCGPLKEEAQVHFYVGIYNHPVHYSRR